MVTKDLNSTEKILVKVDQNNLIYIDPNSVVTNGVIEPRNIEHEKLVLYVNLEADLVPRSYLLADNNQTRYVSIVNKTFNILTPQNGTDLHTDWTEAYNPDPKENNNKDDVKYFNKSDFTDSSGQAFGIESITISIKGANFIPQININFIDVRGKTLFEQPANSPYNTFFHLPWPIFYLTIKGYYGKAIRYRLHLTKFSSKFNSENGNFEISTSFIGSTYAYLNDIPLAGVINAPYLYANVNEQDKKFNQQKGIYEQEIKRTSKGYLMLKSVYSEMKQKGFIDKDFPVITLRELEYLIMQMDKTLEKKIFNEVIDTESLAKLEEYNKALTLYSSEIKSWVTQNISLFFNEYPDVNTGKNEKFYYFILSKYAKESTKLLGTDTGTLESIIKKNNEKIVNIAKDINRLTITTDGTKKIKPIVVEIGLKDVKEYFEQKPNTDRGNELQYAVKVDVLFKDIFEIQRVFFQESSKIMKELEKQINRIVKDDELGLGFEPTIKNLFAILLSNAEVYIRMLKDVHIRAINAGETRKKDLHPFSKETNGEPIYPWPEVKKELPTKKTQILAYPGDLELRDKLKSYDKNIWPEVDFIERYIEFVTKITKTEKSEYIFSGNDEILNLRKISTLFDSDIIFPYGNRVLSSFLYEIFERAKQITLIDSFNSSSVQELAETEFNNLEESLKNDVDVVEVIKKITSISKLLELMKTFSPFERFPYYNDSIPTTDYIKESLESPFSISKHIEKQNETNSGNNDKLTENLKNYQLEPYRKEIFPFSSNTYLNYIKSSKYSVNNFNYSKIFKLESNLGFISSPIDAKMWIKDGYQTNIFHQNLINGNNSTNILNTPYFHRQLYYDFMYKELYGRYAGSAYLLLNSLPFKDLEDNIDKELRMSSLFKEIGATHYVPYFLILKWGSIYHRYKTYLTTDIDILHGDDDKSDFGCLSSGTTTLPINGKLFFDNNIGLSITLTGQTQGNIVINYNNLNENDNKNTGIHPYYDALYHNIINGYTHFNLFEDQEDSFEDAYALRKINCINEVSNNLNNWTCFVDNREYSDSSDNYFTIIPSFGFNTPSTEITDDLLKKYGFTTREEYIDYLKQNGKTFINENQNSFRVIYENEDIIDIFSGKTFNDYGEYIKDINNKFSIGENNKKVFDLIGTFDYKILNQFEEMFLDFVSEQLNEQVPQHKFFNPYNSFQSLLKSISTVGVFEWSYNDINNVKKNLINKQEEKLKEITNNIISNYNLVKFKLSNPKELNSYYFEGFTRIAPETTLLFNPFNNSQLTPLNLKLLKLYIGEFPDSGINYYEEFFTNMNIELNEENIINLRPLILIYSGYRKNNGEGNYSSFSRYIIDNIFTNGANKRLNEYLVKLIGLFPKLKYEKDYEKNVKFYGGYNDNGLKLELYNFFKSYNDKWASGNSVGQRLLFEDFLFLDKSNRDIGDRGYLNLNRFLDLLDTKNSNSSLYNAIAILLRGSGFDMRALPAYVNFYGKSLATKGKVLPSTTVAENLFGTFLDVDYEDSMPKMVIQYVEGPYSKYPDITNTKTYKFVDDSFDISSTNNNPIIITDSDSFSVEKLMKSNRAVAFEVSFGDQNQNIFKGLGLDQTTLRNTTESFIVLENLARSESGAGVAQVDTSLFDYYRQASYTCNVTAMGNMMIQPTMFFYLKNVPMFKGSYWIIDVSHSIKNNSMSTTFKGTRIPRAVLPDPMDSFVASFRPIIDKIINTAREKFNKQISESTTPTTERTINGKYGTYVVEMGKQNVPGEILLENEAGITEFGLPYNGWDGEKDIQKVKHNNKEWFRSYVCKMANKDENEGKPDDKKFKNVISDDTDMSIITYNNDTDKIKWSEIKTHSKTEHFYSSQFKLIYGKATSSLIGKQITTFYNPYNNKSIDVSSLLTMEKPNPNEIRVNYVSGPVSIGPSIDGYGMAMSEKLMYDLGLFEGDIVYFNFK